MTFKRLVTYILMLTAFSCGQTYEFCKQRRHLDNSLRISSHDNKTLEYSYKSRLLINLPGKIIASLIDKGMSDKEDIKKLIQRQILVNREGRNVNRDI